ncbi:MAG TPA: TraR/DksA family transcriptional regulator [Pirellulales bacterium]
MKKAELDKYKQTLLELRSRLRGDVTHLADSGLSLSGGNLSSMPIHLADMGSDTYEQDFTISLMENGGEVLDQIEAALERIEDGTYGNCLECPQKISKARLDAIPYAELCIECASKLDERR